MNDRLSELHPLTAKTGVRAEWRGDLLDGVMVIKGKWADGSPLLAIPNYARNNRNAQSGRGTVGGDASIDYSGASLSGGTATTTNITAAARGGATTNAVAGGRGSGRGGRGGGASIVWMRAE